MTTLITFAPSARRTVIRAGMLASEDGRCGVDLGLLWAGLRHRHQSA
jgi:hypothetical protein